MALPYPAKSRTWDLGTSANGTFFDTEFNQLYANDNNLNTRVQAIETDPAIARAYITTKATPSRVTVAPTAIGEFRSYLRNAGARTYTETNGSPTTAPDSTNGYKLYNGNAFGSADTNNEPSRYEIYIGTNKEPQWFFYKTTGRTGKIATQVFPNWGGSNDVGCSTGYDPVSGIAFISITQNGNQCAPGLDENGGIVLADIYFDIKC